MIFAKEKTIKNFIFTMALTILLGWAVVDVCGDETAAQESVTVSEEITTLNTEQVTNVEESTTIINDGKYSISHIALDLEKGTQFQLEIFNLPQKDAQVTWSTSNKFAVKVSDTGIVTAKNYGVATITAKCKKKIVTCIVTVKDSSRSVVLASKKATVREGETVQLQVTSQNPVTYMVKNEAIASVDEAGVVTGLNPGKTKITAKSATGYATFTIKVKKVESEEKILGKIGDPNYKRIRRCNKKGKVFYNKIVWATNKTIYLKLDGVDETKVKKCKWNTEDNTLLTKPKKTSKKLVATAQTLELEGRTQVTVTVTMKNGKVKIFKSYVYITSPVISTTDLVLLGEKAGAQRQQYITFQGINQYSQIEWTTPQDEAIEITNYENKLAVKGIAEGSGFIKAKVDGKKFKIKYQVYPVKKGTIKPVFAVGKTKKIGINKIEGLTPIYSSRNPAVATVSETGEVTGVSSGVTYIDVNVGNHNFSYRVEIAAEGMTSIIKRGKYILNNWTYSQARRLEDGYYDCSALVWKSYKKYNNYHLLIGGENYAYSAGDLFDFLRERNQIIYYGYLEKDDLKPGDIIFYGDYDMAVKYSTPGRTLDIYHASLYAGAGEIVELTANTIENNSTKYIVGIGRVVN